MFCSNYKNYLFYVFLSTIFTCDMGSSYDPTFLLTGNRIGRQTATFISSFREAGENSQFFKNMMYGSSNYKDRSILSSMVWSKSIPELVYDFSLITALKRLSFDAKVWEVKNNIVKLFINSLNDMDHNSKKYKTLFFCSRFISNNLLLIDSKLIFLMPIALLLSKKKYKDWFQSSIEHFFSRLTPEVISDFSIKDRLFLQAKIDFLRFGYFLPQYVSFSLLSSLISSLFISLTSKVNMIDFFISNDEIAAIALAAGAGDPIHHDIERIVRCNLAGLLFDLIYVNILLQKDR